MSLTTGASPRRIGAALRAARRAAGLRRRDAAAGAGLKTVELRSYERGSDAVPQDVAQRLADSYGCDVSSLLPHRDAAAAVTLEPGFLRVGAASKTLRSDDPHPDEVLKGYLSLLYDMRSMKPGTRIPLRDPDLDALAEALGGTADAIETRLVELMHVTRDEAATMTASLLRRRLVVPAAGLVFGAGLLAGVVKLADEHGTQARTAPTAIDTAASVSKGDPLIGTAASVGRVVDLATIAATPTSVTPANLTPSRDDVTVPAAVVTPPVDVAPPAVVAPSDDGAVPADELIGAPSGEVIAPSDETIGAPSGEVVAPSDTDAALGQADQELQAIIQLLR